MLGRFIVIIGIFISLLCACDQVPPHDPAVVELPADTKPGFVSVSVDNAEESLGSDRAEKLKALQEETSAKVVVGLNAKTGGIKTISFANGTESPTISDYTAHAESFVSKYLGLIDPKILVDELLLRPEQQCYSDAQDANSIRFDRYLDDVPVLGSHLTLHYDGSGRLAVIENSLASVPRSTLADAHSKSSLQDGLKKFTETFQREVLISRDTTPVLVPIDEGGVARLMGGELVLFSDEPSGANENDDGPNTMAGIVLTNGEVVGPWGTGVDTYSSSGFGDVHIDSRTDLPDFITFRRHGGVEINNAGVLDDPVEIVYRFLEQHPSVFRSGNARCQFRLKKTTTLPKHDTITYVKMEQIIAGYLVFGGELVFEVQNGNTIMSVQGHILPEASMPLYPEISASIAQSHARRMLTDHAVYVAAEQKEAFMERAQNADWRGTELLIFPGQLHTGVAADSRLVYKVELDSFVLFVDAINAELVYAFDQRAFDNVVVEGNGLTEGLLDRLNYWRVNVDGIPVAAAAAGNTDIPFAIADTGTTAGFLATHGWTGLNDMGGDFTTITNLALGVGCPNAFFEPYISDNAFFCLGIARNDIVTHEFIHGVIAYSSALVYLDESGALNESYADIMGNLAFPDAIPAGSPPGTLPGWLVGETNPSVTPCVVGGPAVFRDMATPVNCGDPGTWGAYLSRIDLGCGALDIFGTGPGCDSGGVHSNSGINNRAHVLMSDGNAGIFAGMGRPKMRTLAFDVMTNRLGLFSRMLDAALATRASCEAFLAGGVAVVTGAPFVVADCDVVPLAFNAVGLDPDLVSNWVPPTLGFNGTIARFTGETTDNACLITDVAVQMNTPSGVLDASVLTTGAATINYLGLMGVTVPTTTPPIGSTAKGHLLAWNSSFGISPSVSSSLVAPPPAGAVDCFTPAGMTPVQRTSATVTRGIIPNGFGGTEVIGPATSTINAACVLNNTEVEILNNAGQIIAGPGPTARFETTVWVFFVPVTISRDVTITIPPPGPPDLSATVNWGFGVGFVNVTFRLRYFISQPAATACTP